MNLKPKLYIAGPLFSEAEKVYNRDLSDRMSRWFEVYLPQRDGLLFVELIASGKSIGNAGEEVFASDTSAISNCDYFLILLDGRTVDEGACFELGFAFANEKKCIGMQTDPRRLLPIGNNPMISQSVEVVFETIEELEVWADSLY